MFPGHRRQQRLGCLSSRASRSRQGHDCSNTIFIRLCPFLEGPPKWWFSFWFSQKRGTLKQRHTHKPRWKPHPQDLDPFKNPCLELLYPAALGRDPQLSAGKPWLFCGELTGQSELSELTMKVLCLICIWLQINMIKTRNSFAMI